MSAGPLTRLTTWAIAVVALAVSGSASAVHAQATASGNAGIGAYAVFGDIRFDAERSFDAVLGGSSGPLVGGGTRILLGHGGWFFDIGAWRFRGEGERVFVADDTVFPLGIPVTVKVTPIEVSGGWRFGFRRLPKLVPYVAAGLTSLYYQETSDFATSRENADAFFNGYHLLGGAEYKLTRWLGVAGEASWTTVPDAIGEAGVSAAFDENNLGGTTLRLKLTIGR